MTSLNTKTLFKPLSCWCGETKSTPFKKVEQYQVITCTSCLQVRLSNVQINAVSFLEDVSKEKGLEYWGFPEFFKKHNKIFNHFFEERYERIQKARPVEGEWLDIGSGYGFWQKFISDKGITNHGLEIEKQAFLYALSSGVSIELQSIEEFKTTKKFSVITICDVLEHVEKPEEILQKCKEMLLPGGLLYIQVPNVLGLKYPYGDSLGLPHHLWQFEVKTLKNLIKKEKLKILNFWTGIQGVIKYYENGGPNIAVKIMWSLAKTFKFGNRLQILVKHE